MEHLLSVWPGVASRLSPAEHVLLLSDYDGTLTPIVERPELAELPEATRTLLRELARSRRYHIGIISGRALGDLKARVGLADVIYAGNHGLEIEGPAFSFIHPVAVEMKALLNVLYQVLRRGLGNIRGTLVENKGLSLSVHYRQVDQDRVSDVKSAFEQVVELSRQTGQVRTTEGKKVYEVRPAVDWHKGKAIWAILAQQRHIRPKVEPTVIFLGDDLTDEDGFKVVRRLGGIAVFVGEKPGSTSAEYYLHSPYGVREFLSRLVDMERGGM